MVASLALTERTLGAGHPDVGRKLLDYAALLRKTGRKREAASAHARARAILSDREASRRHTFDVNSLWQEH